MKRMQASDILKAVHNEGKIRLDTLVLLSSKLKLAGYKHHFEVSVQSGSLLKVIDTQDLAIQTIQNIDNAIKDGKLIPQDKTKEMKSQ